MMKDREMVRISRSVFLSSPHNRNAYIVYATFQKFWGSVYDFFPKCFLKKTLWANQTENY